MGLLAGERQPGKLALSQGSAQSATGGFSSEKILLVRGRLLADRRGGSRDEVVELNERLQSCEMKMSRMSRTTVSSTVFL